MEGVPKFQKVGYLTPFRPALHFAFLSLVPLVMILHAKFDISTSDHSRYMEGNQNFKSRSRDPFLTTSDLILHFFR